VRFFFKTRVIYLRREAVRDFGRWASRGEARRTAGERSHKRRYQTAFEDHMKIFWSAPGQHEIRIGERIWRAPVAYAPVLRGSLTAYHHLGLRENLIRALTISAPAGQYPHRKKTEPRPRYHDAMAMGTVVSSLNGRG